MLYNLKTRGCECPSDYYKNKYGICEKLILKQIGCRNGQYFNSSVGCVMCESPCANCLSATKCLSCLQEGYDVNRNGLCVPKCGDGMIVPPETCDTGSNFSAGCLSCKVEPGWRCSGLPSVCSLVIRPPTAPVTPIFASKPALTQ